MVIDSVVQEVRAAREAYAEQFGFDLQAIHRDLKERERSSGHPVVSFPPRRPEIHPHPRREPTGVPA